jgi:PDZ domain-containing protein
MTRRTQTLVVAAVLALVLGIVGLWLPVPFVTLAPGPVTDTLGTVHGVSLIEVDGRRTYGPKTGRLELTTVEETPRLNLLGALQDWLNSDRAVVPRELIDPPGSSQTQIQQENTTAMLTSQEQATIAALGQLGIKPTGTQIVVLAVPDGSPATDKLQPGDVITAVDGTPIHSQAALSNAISRVKPGHDVTISYQRGSSATAITDITTRLSSDNPKRAIIGIQASEKPTYPFTVRIRLSDVGGPSAGLMFALGIIDLLTPQQLTDGLIIAGTGTIDPQGNVGPIGGIQQKILGARGSGARVFLVPADNCADARRMAPSGLRLIRVTNLAGALSALQMLGGPRQASIPSC